MLRSYHSVFTNNVGENQILNYSPCVTLCVEISPAVANRLKQHIADGLIKGNFLVVGQLTTNMQPTYSRGQIQFSALLREKICVLRGPMKLYQLGRALSSQGGEG